MPTKSQFPVNTASSGCGDNVEPACAALSPVRGLIGVDARYAPHGKEAMHGGRNAAGRRSRPPQRQWC
eukprot:5292352-Lingulodinium_polyedra.AAC.1